MLKYSPMVLAPAGLTLIILSTAGVHARGGGNAGPPPSMKVWQPAEPDSASPVASDPGSGGASPGRSRKEEIHQVLYKIYKSQRRFDLADKEVTAIVALDPNNALIHQDWGHELMIASKFAQALPHYLKVIKVDPGNGDAFACVGDCYMQLGKYGAALDAYRKAVSHQRPGADYRSRVQMAQQYIDNLRQQQVYKENLKKQKESADSDE